MLAEHSKKLEHSLTHQAASFCPPSPTAERAVVEQTEPFQQWGWFFTQEEQRTPTYNLINTFSALLLPLFKFGVCTNVFFTK